MSEISFDQANFPVRIISKLEGKLQVASVSGTEQMGRLFEFDLELVSNEPDLHFDEVVGQQVNIELNLENGEPRNFNGLLTEFHYAGATGQSFRYRAKMRPWFWFLTRTADCKIFQEKTVPEIIKEVFRDNGMSDFDDQLKGTYRKWEYCVQYRESDFNFISRLMEQEGIYYYFEHSSTKHTLVMVDEMASHGTFLHYSEIPFNDFHGSHAVNEDTLDFWTTSQSIMPSRYAIDDFDFKKPKADLLSKIDPRDVHHDMPPTLDPEIFDYPGEYKEPDDGNNCVAIRLQELKCQQEKVFAGGNHRGLSPGYTFTLTGHGRADQEVEHVVVSIKHQINNADFYGSSGETAELYRCQVQLMKTDRPYRSARDTPKPIVQGLQTAVVVGPSSDEIYTDEYGRVKCQFHWDRYGNNDENSSCWIRVSQIWAGKNWGSMHIPRIGQEIIVSFMEGDPDQPVITGRVYNAVNMPPYDLEGSKTQSGIKSRSTSGGGSDNFNEIRMEDKKGSEELYIQAEKDQNILVKNNKSDTVGNDKTEDIGHDETVTIGNNRTETVAVDETLTVNNNRTRNVLNTETVTVSKFRNHIVGINESITVGAAQEVSVGGLQMVEIGAAQNVDVGLSQSISVGRSRSLDVGKDYNVNVGDDLNSNVGSKESTTIGKEWVVEVGDSVTIKCGSSRIVMKKNGNIQLKGKDITFKASGKIGLKASKTITLKGSNIKEN